MSSQQAPGVIARLPHFSRELPAAILGCWEPGRPPESFPLSCSSSSLSSLCLFCVTYKHLVPRLRERPGLGACRAPGSERLARVEGRGEGSGKPLLPQSGPGSGRGKLLAPRGLAACGGPCGAVHRSRLEGTCHRRLPPRPTRAARGGGGGGSGGCSGRDLGGRRSVTGLRAAVDGF